MGGLEGGRDSWPLSRALLAAVSVLLSGANGQRTGVDVGFGTDVNGVTQVGGFPPATSFCDATVTVTFMPRPFTVTIFTTGKSNATGLLPRISLPTTDLSLSVPSALPGLPSLSLSLPELSSVPLITGLPSNFVSASTPGISSVSVPLPSLTLPSTSLDVSIPQSLPTISLSSLNLPLSLPEPSLELTLTNIPSVSLQLPSVSLDPPGLPTLPLTSAIAPLPTASVVALVSCPADDGLNYLSSSGNIYQIECSIERNGYDILSLPQPNLQSCIDSCGGIPGCTTVSFTPTNRTCSYKSANGQGLFNVLWQSAVAVDLSCPSADGAQYLDSTGGLYQVLCDYSFADTDDLTTTPGTDYTDCSDRCSTTPSCTGFSYEDGTCTFFSGLGSPTGKRTPGVNTVVLVAKRAIIVAPNGSTLVSSTLASLLPSYTVSASLVPLSDLQSITVSLPNTITAIPTNTEFKISTTAELPATLSRLTLGIPSSTISDSVLPSLTLGISEPSFPTDVTTFVPTEVTLYLPTGTTIILQTAATLSLTTDVTVSLPSSIISSVATDKIQTSLPGITMSLPTSFVGDETTLPRVAISLPTELSTTDFPTSLPSLDTSVDVGALPTALSSVALSLPTDSGISTKSASTQFPSDPSTTMGLGDLSASTSIQNVDITSELASNTNIDGTLLPSGFSPFLTSGAGGLPTPSTSDFFELPGNVSITLSVLSSLPTSTATDSLVTTLPSGLLSTIIVPFLSGTSSSSSIDVPSVSIPTLASSSLSTSVPGIPDLGGVTGGDTSTARVLTTPTIRYSSATAPTSQGPTQSAVVYTCPNASGQVITENGISYVLGCGNATTGTPYSSKSATNSFNDCFQSCDQSSTTDGANYCTAFTYAGAPDGVGSGTCYLYNGVTQGLAPAGRNYISAVRAANYYPGQYASGSSASVSLLPLPIPTVSLPLPSTSETIYSTSIASVGFSNTVIEFSSTTNLPIGSNSGLSLATPTPTPTQTCANGDSILDGCVVASVTAKPGAGISGGVGLSSPSSSTILDVGLSATAGASVTIGAGAGVGVGLSSTLDLDVSLSLTLGVAPTINIGGGLGIGGGEPGAMTRSSTNAGTVSASAPTGSTAASLGTSLSSNLPTPAPGLPSTFFYVTPLAPVITTTVMPSPTTSYTTVWTTSTVTSCLTGVGGVLTCPVGGLFTTLPSASISVTSISTSTNTSTSFSVSISYVYLTVTSSSSSRASFATVTTSSSSMRTTTSAAAGGSIAACLGVVNALGVCVAFGSGG